MTLINFWRRRRDSNPRDPFEPNGFEVTVFGPTWWLGSDHWGRKEDRHKGVFLVQAIRGSVYL